MNRFAAALAVLLCAASVRGDTPPAPAPAVTGGGDGSAKPRAPSMIIEEDPTPDESTPPAPIADEKRAIGDYIRDHSGDIQDCYAKRLQEKPTLQGKLVARFDIGPSGRVIGATADGIRDRELVVCVMGVVRQWQFDKPAAGGKLRIAYPWKFEPRPAR